MFFEYEKVNIKFYKVRANSRVLAVVCRSFDL